MTPEQKHLVQTSFEKVKPIADTAATLFYGCLFNLDPNLERLFKGNLHDQGRKLMHMIGLAVMGLNRLDELVPLLHQLGARHAGYGVTEHDYETVGDALLWALEHGLGDEFTPAVRDAWIAVYELLAETMKAGASEALLVSATPMSNEATTSTGGVRNGWREYFPVAAKKTLKRMETQMQTDDNYETLTGRLVTTLITLVCALFLFAATAQANTYVVTDNADTDGQTCGATCTLRQAINAANSHAGFDLIDFNIPGAGVRTITLLSELPGINDSVYIDGYTQRPCSGNPAPCAKQNTLAVGNDAVLLIELNGGGISASAHGLVVNAVSCTVRGLVINRFREDGIRITGSASGTLIAGNWIGLDKSGSFHQSNQDDGVYIDDSSNNTIGGTTPAARNVISGNDIPAGAAGVGVNIIGNAASGNKIQGNYIGTDISGVFKVANRIGVRVANQAHGTTIGGAVAGSGNLISGNDSYGLTLENAYNNLIQGNIVGLDASGTDPVGNGFQGISLTNNSITNTIGGTTPGARNVISSNGSTGILIQNSSNNVVEGNYVGTNSAGDSARANQGDGIWINTSVQPISPANTNKIGDFVAGSGNIISGNKGNGVVITGDVSGTLVLRNLIGTKADGTSSLPNEHNGVYLGSGAHNNSIGSTTAGVGNVIAYNGSLSGEGVFMHPTAGLGNAIRRNSIYSNNGLGIMLAFSGVLDNDLDDPDSGANNLQNFPVIASATSNAGLTTVTGTLNSTADTDFRIEFFANDACDPSGYGEGKTFLGAVNATTSGNNATFSASFPGFNLGQFVTATATDSSGNTSEFSQCKQVTAPVTAGSIAFSAAAYNVGEGGGVATVTVARAGGSGGAVSVQYQTGGGTATANSDYTPVSGTLSWADGDATNKTFTISITNDNLDEPDETLGLTLSSPAGGASLGNQSTATLTIVDNDPPMVVSIIGVSHAEGNSGTTNFVFNVLLSDTSGQTVTVAYATIAGGTATLGNDYQAASGTLTFAPGEGSKTVTVLVNGDTTIEPDETFFVQLSNPTNATLGITQATGTIVNDDAPAGPAFGFSQANYSVAEQLGAVTVTVTRSGDSSGSASVDYATVDGTATQKSDFEIAAGTLNFAPGEVSKTIQVLLNQDMYIEGPETFSVLLSNPSGAVLGQPSAPVTITDDVPESATNPIDDPQSFVHMHYHDFLNREPDQAGLQFWTNNITSCGQDAACVAAHKVDVSAAYFLSIEFQQTGFLLHLMQKESFGALPKYANFMRDLQEVSQGVVVNSPGWEQKLAANQQQFAEAWVNRSGFKAAYDGMSNAAYVNALYANAGVVPPQAEHDGLVTALDTATQTRSSVLLEVTANAAFRQQEQNPAFVLMQYFGYLRRDPDSGPDSDLSGYYFWLQKLNSFNGDYQQAEMVKAFLDSLEYRGRFGQ